MKTKLFFALILVALLVAPLWAKGPSDPTTSTGLTDTEEANLLYLFEEEKLAHDIYVEMYNSYGAYVFNNISESEQRHMASIEKLILKYELDDTVLINALGIFTNSVIQDEYDRLLGKGKLNLISALEVGVEIEEMDIGDIERMQEETDKTDIGRVLSNLLDGSYNHLEAFKTQLGIFTQ
jgi:hypothetical protein